LIKFLSLDSFEKAASHKARASVIWPSRCIQCSDPQRYNFHSRTISRQIDYLGKMPTVTPKPVKTSEDAKEMLRFDLDNENETVRNYRERIRQCEALGEFAMAEQIRQILMQEQDHQIDLATALGEEVPDMSKPSKRS
jgi:bacterioferritin